MQNLEKNFDYCKPDEDDNKTPNYSPSILQKSPVLFHKIKDLLENEAIDENLIKSPEPTKKTMD